MELTNEEIKNILDRAEAEDNNPSVNVSDSQKHSRLMDRFYAMGRVMLAGLGITSSAAAINACTPTTPKPAEVSEKPTQTPNIETVSLKKSIQVTNTENLPTLTPSPTPESTATPTVTPTPEVKSLPEVISNQTVKFVTPPVEEVQKAFEESVKQGDPKIALPEDVAKKNLEVKTIISLNAMTKQPLPIIGIYSQQGQQIEIPALINGKVITARGSLLSGGSTYNIVEIEGEKGIIVTYAFPSGSKRNVKVGQEVLIGTSLFSTSYQPDTPGQQQFEKNPAWKNAALVINLGQGDLPIGKGIESLLTDKAGNFPTVAPSP